MGNDVQAKMHRTELDKIFKDSHESQDQQEMDRKVDEAVQSSSPGDGDEPITEEERNMIGLKARFVQVTRTFHAPDLAAQHRAKMDRLAKDKLGGRADSALGSNKDGRSSHRDDKSASATGPVQYFPLVPEQWREKIRDLKQLYVMKYPKIFQALFYFLQFKPRDYVCERDTNKLDWKRGKSFINDDMFSKMGDYWPIGPKEMSFKEYEQLKFVQSCTAGISEEELEEYSVALCKLYKWLKLAIDVRVEDVKMRRGNKKRLKEKREKAIDAERERMEKR